MFTAECTGPRTRLVNRAPRSISIFPRLCGVPKVFIRHVSLHSIRNYFDLRKNSLWAAKVFIVWGCDAPCEHVVRPAKLTTKKNLYPLLRHHRDSWGWWSLTLILLEFGSSIFSAAKPDTPYITFDFDCFFVTIVNASSDIHFPLHMKYMLPPLFRM